jgi:drug/metabolite transporter (DMT)-like permease
MSMHTIILTASPVIAVIWSVLLFHSEPTLQQLAGGAAILIGIAMVTLSYKRR